MADFFYVLPAPLRERATWMVASSAMSKIVQMRDSNGLPFVEQNPQAGTPRTLFGRPLIENADMAQVGANSVSVALGDFSVFEVVRLPVRLELSRDYRYATDEVALKVVERCDARLVDVPAVQTMRSSAT